MTMGDKIRALRKQNKLTLQELGDRLGVGKSAIAKYERGEVENIPRTSIVKMAEIFGVTPEYLLAFSGDENSGYEPETMIREYLIAKYGEEIFRFFDRLSTMTDANRKKLFEICELINKAEIYDEMLAHHKEIINGNI